MVLYEEKYTVKTIVWTSIIAGLVITTSSIAVLSSVPKTETLWPIILIDALVILPVIFLLAIMTRFEVKIDEKTLSFGYPPIIVRIPLEQIDNVTFTKVGFLSSGGIGIRLSSGGGWNYVTFWGDLARVEWSNGRRHGFSVKNPEEVKRILGKLLGKDKILEDYSKR
ncbi:MAG: hypothetical protein GX421_02395 [Caldisericales bacterium]|nr:hypothetical protein [Caldisericales bacterium]